MQAPVRAHDPRPPEPVPPITPDPQPPGPVPTPPPIEKEQGPQVPIELPGKPGAPERVA